MKNEEGQVFISDNCHIYLPIPKRKYSGQPVFQGSVFPLDQSEF